jgi:hypothetical protein
MRQQHLRVRRFTLTPAWEYFGWTPVFSCTADAEAGTFDCDGADNNTMVGPCIIGGRFIDVAGTFNLDSHAVTITAETERTAGGGVACSTYSCSTKTVEGSGTFAGSSETAK